MRYLVVAVGSHGDIHPLMGVALGLRRRGHEVIFLANGYFESLARSAGVDFAALGSAEEFRAALGDADLWHARRGFKAVFQRGVLPQMRLTYDAIAERHRPGQTIVVAHAIAFGARIARDKLGVPLVTTQLQPAVFRSLHDIPRLPGMPATSRSPRWFKKFCWWLADAAAVEPVLRRPVNDFLGELGLPPASGILRDWWMSPDRVLGLFPDWFGPVQPDWPPQTRLTGFPLYDESGATAAPEDLEAFLGAGEPPIAFTPGSAMTFADDFFAESVAACGHLGRRAILLSRHREHIPHPLPPHARHFEYVPFSALLPRCCALVHHGGIGTTAQALAAGLPQLIMPLAHDQFDNAARVEALGAGLRIARSAYEAPAVAAKLSRLTTDAAIAGACRDVAARFTGVDGLASACDEIERFAAERLGSSPQTPGVDGRIPLMT